MASYQRLKVMVRKHIDQMIRTHNFSTRNERTETRVLFKSQQREQCQCGKENVISGKANGQCSRGDSCTFNHGNNRGEEAQSSSLSPKTQTQIDGRRPSTGKGKCTELPCGYWHPPECQNYMSESGCEFGDHCLFRHTEADGSPVKSRRKVVERIGCFAEGV